MAVLPSALIEIAEYSLTLNYIIKDSNALGERALRNRAMLLGQS